MAYRLIETISDRAWFPREQRVYAPADADWPRYNLVVSIEKDGFSTTLFVQTSEGTQWQSAPPQVVPLGVLALYGDLVREFCASVSTG